MQQLGRYTLMRRVGVGGMAEIWKAQVQGPAGFQKTVAIKKILPHLLQDEEFIGMFVEEAKLVARLVHPNIVQVFDFGMARDGEDNGYFIAMEYVSGQNLAAIQKKLQERRHRMPYEIALYIGIETAKALAHAHAGHAVMSDAGEPQQIVHRDVSPHNVLVSYLGEVKVTDFGIAKVANAMHRTSGGILKGKVAYMSPEQAKLKPLDGRSDIFCLGIVLFHLISGRPLFDGRRTEEIYQKITTFSGLTPQDLAGLPPEVGEILEIALQPEPDDRYQHATALEAALSQVLGPSGVIESRRALGTLLQKLFPDDYQRERSGVFEDSTTNNVLPGDATSVSGAMEFGGETSVSKPSLQVAEVQPNKSDSFSVARRVPSLEPKKLTDSRLPAEKKKKSGSRITLLLVILGVALITAGVLAREQIRTALGIASPGPEASPTATAEATATDTKVAVATPPPTHRRTPRPTARPTQRATVQTTPRPTPRPTAVPHGKGTLTVNARPWVRVIVDGKTVTKETPLRNYRLSSGDHTVVFINPVEKFRSSRKITVYPNQETKIFVDAKTGKIKIN